MSQNLAPPVAPNRHRAHSTNLRPALTINTLGRRRSCSLGRGPETASPAPQSCGSSCSSSAITPVQTDLPVLSSEPDTPPTMFAVIASRCIQFLQLSPKHSLQWSTPSSPRSSTDEYVLPISASSYQTTFDDVHGEKEISTTRTPSAWWQGYSSVRPTFLLILVHFSLTFVIDSRTHIVCGYPVSPIGCSHTLLSFNITHSYVMATHHHRCGFARYIATRLFAEWT